MDPLPFPLPRFDALGGYPQVVRDVYQFLFVENLQLLEGLADMLGERQEGCAPVSSESED